MIKADRLPNGKMIKTYWESKKGKKVQSGLMRFFPLKSHNQQKAAAEKIADRTKSRQAAARTGRRKGKGQGGERTLVLLLPTCTKVLGSWG